jgi:hypothetical protein
MKQTASKSGETSNRPTKKDGRKSRQNPMKDGSNYSIERNKIKKILFGYRLV